MTATCCKISGCLEVDVLEALAAKHSISIALEAGFNKLVLESDSQKLTNYLKQSKFEHEFWPYRERYPPLS
uniref:RNase H type-1 domain-containing protein n=1 Tax=Chenopodium quinoa TaxID=63459 RepID=A0A803N2Y9_CHEQI